MSTKIGTVDRLVKTSAVADNPKGGYTKNVAKQLVKEPKIFPYELQQLPVHEVVCSYKGQVWKGQATPYFINFL